MLQPDLFLLFTGPLDDLAVVYMVGGSVASMVYGEPRLTNDIDLVVDLSVTPPALLTRAFPDTAFYCPPEEVMIMESRRLQRGHFNIIHHETGYKADCYMRGKDALQAWGLENRSWIDFPGQRGIWVAPPEYVILRKLEYFREGGSDKHIHDICGMLDASNDMIRHELLNDWIAELRLETVWNEISR